MKSKSIENELQNASVDELIQAITSLENGEEAKKFLRDLLTKQEIIEFAKRWETAQLLDDNISYIEIEKKTGLSSTTIARISKWLKRGCGGYRLLIDRIHHHSHAPLKKNA